MDDHAPAWALALVGVVQLSLMLPVLALARRAGRLQWLHGYQGWAGVIDTAAYGGLALSLLTLWRRGRIAAAMAAHAGWNAIATAGLVLLY